MDYRSSLMGFHNPYKHRGLTPEQFLDKYIQAQKLKGMRKRNGGDRLRLVGWIEAHKESQIKFVAKLFPHTLKVEQIDVRSRRMKNAEIELKRNAFKLTLPKYRQKTIKVWEIDRSLKLLGQI